MKYDIYEEGIPVTLTAFLQAMSPKQFNDEMASLLLDDAPQATLRDLIIKAAAVIDGEAGEIPPDFVSVSTAIVLEMMYSCKRYKEIWEKNNYV